MTDLGDLKYILGIQVIRDRENGTVKLTQKEYIKRVLEKYRIEQGRVMKSPINKGVKLVYREMEEGDGSKQKIDSKIYQSAIGSLMYLCQVLDQYRLCTFLPESI